MSVFSMQQYFSFIAIYPNEYCRWQLTINIYKFYLQRKISNFNFRLYVGKTTDVRLSFIIDSGWYYAHLYIYDIQFESIFLYYCIQIATHSITTTTQNYKYKLTGWPYTAQHSPPDIIQILMQIKIALDFQIKRKRIHQLCIL